MFGIAFLAPVAAFFAGKIVPWKWIGVGLAVLAILGSIGGGVFYVNNLQAKYTESQKELAIQTLATDLANQRAGQIQSQHDEQVVRVDELEKSRSALSEDVSKLRAEMSALDLEVDIDSDKPEAADAAIARLNAAHVDLNGLLDRASRNLRGRAPAQ